MKVIKETEGERFVRLVDDLLQWGKIATHEDVGMFISVLNAGLVLCLTRAGLVKEGKKRFLSAIDGFDEEEKELKRKRKKK